MADDDEIEVDDGARAQLADDARDLVDAAASGRLPAADLRDADAATLLAHLERGRSVLLVGADGVGRTTVVRALARQLAAGARHGVGGLFELSTHQLLSDASGPGAWTSKLHRVLAAAAETRSVLFVPDVWNLPAAGGATDVASSLLEIVRPWVADGRVALIGEVSPDRLRQLEQTPGFVALFVQQAVEPLGRDQVDQVLERAAGRLGLDLGPEARHTLVELTSRFLASRPQPGPALEMLGRVDDYQAQKAGIDEHEVATPAFVERVFSIYSGLPRFVVARSATRAASEIRAWFDDQLVGQREAIEAVVQAIALFKAGLHDPRRPLGTFLFVGPTGVGKTELARALATFLFGSAHRMLRIDLGEFEEPSSLERLLGDPRRPGEPALLTDAVGAQPFQVVLFDALEKAEGHVLDVLLRLLDEGRVTTPRGDTLDVRSCFVVCTTHVDAPGGEPHVDGEDPALRRRRTLAAVEAAFRPELLDRFQHVVPFHPLDGAMVRRVARRELKHILLRDGITSRNLVVEVDDAAIDLVIRHGFDPRWGARGLARELQRRVVLPLAMTLMESRVEPGQILKVTGVDGRIRVRRLDTENSLEHRREAEPIQLSGRTWDRADLEQGVRRLREDLEALLLGVGVHGVLATQENLLAARAEPDFWSDQDRAARDLRELDHHTRTLDRLDRLCTRVDDLTAELAVADTRGKLMGIGQRLGQLRTAMTEALRELVHMGREGACDALVEVTPVGEGRMARDHLVRMYVAWAEQQAMEIVWLRDPRDDDEPAIFAVRGPYAYGLLRLEAGAHRVRDGDDHATARVRVGPWIDRTKPVVFADHQAIKGAIGTFGGRIRSRLTTGDDLVLQNGRTLTENRDLAVEVAVAWADLPHPSDDIVRRYDLVAPMLRDVLTGESSTRPDATAPERLHELLCRRVDLAGQGPEAA